MSNNYPEIKSGQAVDLDWRHRDYKIACCDCGLVHCFRFTVVRGKLRIRAWRDNRSTAALRRHRNVKISVQADEMTTCPDCNGRCYTLLDNDVRGMCYTCHSIGQVKASSLR